MLRTMQDVKDLMTKAQLYRRKFPDLDRYMMGEIPPKEHESEEGEYARLFGDLNNAIRRYTRIGTSRKISSLPLDRCIGEEASELLEELERRFQRYCRCGKKVEGET